MPLPIENTVLRGRTFHFRRAVPADLRSRLKRLELSRSLGTSDRRLAQIAARQLYLQSELVFERIRAEPMLSDDQIAEVVRDFYDWILDLEGNFRLRQRRLDATTRKRRANKFGELASEFREALGANDFDRVSRTATMLVRNRQLVLPEELLDQRKLKQALLRGWIELSTAIKARYEGDFNYEPKDKLLQAALATSRVAVNEHTAPDAQGDDRVGGALVVGQDDDAEAEKFSLLASAFVERQKRLKRWENQTAAQNTKSYALFVDVCEDKPLSKYLRPDAARFKNALEQLPADYGKAARYHGQSVLSIMQIDEAGGGQGERLSTRTVKRHMSALSALWDEHIPKGDVTNNIFSGFKFPNQKRARDQRPMWSRSDLQKLFATPVWTGCASASRRSAPGSMIIRDEAFWLPVIAVLSGCRQEEICQLHTADIRLEEGVWVFDINENSPKRLKNGSSVRLVPIHETLIQIGFLDYVGQQSNAGSERVFPAMKPGGADGRLGHNFTKWFTRYRRDVDVYEHGKDFHSFRHSATTWLHQGGVESSIIDRLTGHTTPGETARYSKGSHVHQLKAAIDRLDIGVDLTHLLISEHQG